MIHSPSSFGFTFIFNPLDFRVLLVGEKELRATDVNRLPTLTNTRVQFGAVFILVKARFALDASRTRCVPVVSNALLLVRIFSCRGASCLASPFFSVQRRCPAQRPLTHTGMQ